MPIVIYLDSSVVLAYLLAESRAPAHAVFDSLVVSSRLVEYEVWNRLHAYDLSQSHGTVARSVLARISMLDLESAVLARALAPFPVRVRTLDGLHLASIQYLQSDGRSIALATYDHRMQEAAEAMGIAVVSV